MPWRPRYSGESRHPAAHRLDDPLVDLFAVAGEQVERGRGLDALDDAVVGQAVEGEGAGVDVVVRAQCHHVEADHGLESGEFGRKVVAVEVAVVAGVLLRFAPGAEVGEGAGELSHAKSVDPCGVDALGEYGLGVDVEDARLLGGGRGMVGVDDGLGAVTQVEGVTKVTVEFVWSPPWSPSKMSEDGKKQMRMFGFNL